VHSETNIRLGPRFVGKRPEGPFDGRAQANVTTLKINLPTCESALDCAFSELRPPQFFIGRLVRRHRLGLSWKYVLILATICRRMRANDLSHPTLDTRDARRYIFKPNPPSWVNFAGSCNGICWYILWTFGLFYGHLVYFMVIWYILWTFGIISWLFGIFCGKLVKFLASW
jgi:hypothetical protein